MLSKRKYTNRISPAISLPATTTGVPSRNREVTPGDFNERTRQCSSTLPRARCDSSNDLQFQLVPSPSRCLCVLSLSLFSSRGAREGQANERRVSQIVSVEY